MFDVRFTSTKKAILKRWPFVSGSKPLLATSVFLVEALDPAFGIDQFGVTRVEGMTVSAGVHVHFGTGGTGFGDRATGTVYFGIHIFGVKICFHGVLLEIG